MKTEAAILVETGHPLEVVELEVPALGAGQVLVEVLCSGVCHTQLLEVRGFRGVDRFLPHCLGHEGTGRVLETGREVTKCQVGDRVILSWMRGAGRNVPGSVYRWNGRTVNAGGVTTFQRHAIVSEDRLVGLPDGVDDRQGALLGCAVATGFGSVINTAQTKAGESAAVFGLGGIGMSAIAAAVHVGADPVCAIDVNPDRLELARKFGATHFINPEREDLVGRLAETFAAGLDHAFEATGRPAVMQQALAAVRGRGGSVVVIGNARHGERLEIDPSELNSGKRILGTWGGDNDPDRDFARYANLVANGQLDLRPLIPRTYTLAEINSALDDLEQGVVPRPIIELNSDAVTRV